MRTAAGRMLGVRIVDEPDVVPDEVGGLVLDNGQRQELLTLREAGPELFTLAYRRLINDAARREHVGMAFEIIEDDPVRQAVVAAEWGVGARTRWGTHLRSGRLC